jgi:hypothetical protein
MRLALVLTVLALAVAGFGGLVLPRLGSTELDVLAEPANLVTRGCPDTPFNSDSHLRARNFHGNLRGHYVRGPANSKRVFTALSASA